MYYLNCPSIVFILFSTVSGKSVVGDQNLVANEDVESKEEVVVNDLSKNNESYWTQENLNKVKPYPSPTTKHIHYHYGHTDSLATATDPKSNRFARQSTGAWSPTETEVLSAQPKITVKNGPAQVESADVTDSTFKPMGKLLFVDNEDTHYHCSGQYISDYIVLTAGHCVYSVETGGWNSDFRFIQNYVGKVENRSRTSSLFGKTYKGYEGTPRRVAKVIVAKKWFSEGIANFTYDFAFLTMKDPSIGGFYTIGYPESYDSWINAGYPVKFDQGELLKKYVGKKGVITEELVETPGNPMGPGSAGGAWIAEKKYVVGLNSFSFVGRESMFSPHFEAKRIQAVLDRAKAVLSASQT